MSSVVPFDLLSRGAGLVLKRRLEHVPVDRPHGRESENSGRSFPTGQPPDEGPGQPAA
jgi:hypothetical protein